MMMRTLTLAALAATPLVLWPRDAAAPQDPHDLLHAIPAEAALFVRVTDLEGLRRASESNAWGRMLRDDDVVALWDWVLDRLDEEDQDFSKEITRFIDAVEGGVTFFAGGEDLSEVGILVDAGDGQDELRELIEEVDDGDRESSYEEYAGVSLELWATAGEEDGSLTHNVGWEQGGVFCYVAAPEEDRATELAHGMLDRLGGADEPSMFSNPQLASARAGAAPGRVEFFVDLHRLVGANPEIQEDLDEEALRIADLIGARGFTWAHGTMDLGEGEDFDLHLRMSTPTEGYAKRWLDTLGPIPVGLAGLAPSNSRAVSLYNADVFELYQSGWDLFADIDPEQYEQTRAAFEGGLAAFGGLDLEADLLAQLSGNFGQFSIPVSEAEMRTAMGVMGDVMELPEELLQGDVYAIGIEDSDTVELFLEETLNAVGPMTGLNAASIESEDFQGFPIQSLELPTGQALSWCFTEDYLLGSMYPSALRASLTLHGDADAPSARNHELFAPHLERHAGAWTLQLAPSRTTAETLLSLPQFFLDLGLGDEGVWDNLDTGEETTWDFESAPLPGPELAGRYLEGTMILKFEYAQDALQVSIMAR